MLTKLEHCNILLNLDLVSMIKIWFGGSYTLQFKALVLCIVVGVSCTAN